MRKIIIWSCIKVILKLTSNYIIGFGPYETCFKVEVRLPGGLLVNKQGKMNERILIVIRFV